MGGSSTHTLSESELPALKKPLTYEAGVRITVNNGTHPGYHLEWSANSDNRGPDLFVQLGGGGTHNNMQPNIALAYIIKF